MTTNELTTVEKRGSHYYKREDEFVINGVCGGKARVINEIVTRLMSCGYTHFVTCGSRDSRQCEVLAKVCELHGVSSHLFMPSGNDTDIIRSIEETKYATIHRTKVGYNTVLIAESRKYANNTGAFYIPFGMGSSTQTSREYSIGRKTYNNTMWRWYEHDCGNQRIGVFRTHGRRGCWRSSRRKPYQEF